MKIYSEAQILEGIVKNQSGVIEYVYEAYYPVIEGFVIHNQGSSDQARDVFQEGMIVIFRKLKQEDLSLNCKFGTYLYSICKRIWFQEKKKTLLQQKKLTMQPLYVEEPGNDKNELDNKLLREFIEELLSKLSPDCQKILRLSLNDFTVEEIRQAMNYNSIHHAIDRKYRCKKSLIKKILSDPLFKRIIDEIR